MYEYSYALGLIIPGIIWTILLIYGKTRQEQLIFSSLAGFFAPLLAFVHTRDWWQPQTLTQTAVGIEDVLYAFFICGIATSIYSFVMKKQYIEGKRKDTRVLFLLLLGVSMFLLFSYLFNSIIGFIVPAIVTTAFMLYKRHDLWKYSLLSGVMVMIISIPSYLLVELITPGWIANTWYLHNLTGIQFLGIPLEEFIWHFFIGASMGLVYKYWFDSKEKTSTTSLRQNTQALDASKKK